MDSKGEGLDLYIDQGGHNLSGGQRQRLTIARALVRRPEILIMDDSASALDFATDARLRKAIRENTGDMTVFIVSQRATTIKSADTILVLDEGRLAGMAPIRSFLRTARYTGRFVCHSFQRRRWNGMSSKKNALDKNRSRETLKRILKYISQYKWSVILSLFLALITVALTLYVPILTGRAVDRIVSAGHVDFAGLKGILITILGAVAVTSVSQWLMNHINNIITYRVVKDIRTRAFNQLEVMPLSYIDVHPSGDIISRIIADIDQFSEGLLMGFTQLFTGVLTIAGTLLFMLSIQPVITAVVVVLTPISLFVASFIAKKTFVMFRKQSETRGELTSLTDEMLGNMKVVQAFGHQEEAQKQFEEINERLAGYSLRATFFSSITNPAPALLTAWSMLPWASREPMGLSGVHHRGTADQFPQLRQPVHKAL